MRNARPVVLDGHMQAALNPLHGGMDGRALRAGLAHGQRGIGEQVDQHADHRGFVAQHQRIGRQLARDGHPAQLMRGQPDRGIQRLLEQEWRALRFSAGLAIGEGLQVRHDMLDALHPLLGVDQALLQHRFVLGHRLFQRDFDRHQAEVDRVVDLVQQARCQRADGGHLFLLQHLALDVDQLAVDHFELAVLLRHFGLQPEQHEARPLIEEGIDRAGRRGKQQEQ